MAKRGEYLQAEVLKIMQRRAEPLSAYGILDELRKSDARMAPTTVYRVLAALKEHKRIHRLESLNAYVVSHCEGEDDTAILSICDDCGAVEEKAAPDLVKDLSSMLEKGGFSAQRHVIEVHGTCGACGDEEDPT